MDLGEYQRLVGELGFGKRLPTAVYVYREEGVSLGEGIDRLVAQVVAAFQIRPEFNVLKFRTDELKVSFLCYPRFFEDPHPALRHAITIDLARGKARETDYSENLNPPILHRKETFLAGNHPQRGTFEALTRQEEEAGLYEKTTTIGFKLNWERLLAEKGVAIEGHSLRKAGVVVASETALGSRVAVHRHKTAMTRYDLSKPVKSLVEYGLLRAETTFFDYGCGQGADVDGLRALGHQADGWDPVYRPTAPKREADVVNLGYVVNVIEDPAERVDALVDAFRHARRLLVVSGLIQETVVVETAERLHDGVLTKRNTFQKYFEQQELQQYIEDALDSSAVPVSLGVFYVFRDPVEQQDFLSARTRRAIDWTQISARLGLGAPARDRWEDLYKEHKELLDAFGNLALRLGRMPTLEEFGRLTETREKLGSEKRALRAYVQGGGAPGQDWAEVAKRFGIGLPPKAQWELVYEANRGLLDTFWQQTLELGRLPLAEEFPRFGEVVGTIGSAKRALSLFLRKGGEEELKKAEETRRNDLLVYVALANLRKRVPFGYLSGSLRADIRAFFGNYTRALEHGLELLYAAGDSGEIEFACEGLKVGWQDQQALYLHRSLLEQLPPVLRAYVGCATTLFGDVAQADVVKVHKASGKVTFLAYDDFEGKPLPELQRRTKVNLRTRWVETFDHSADGQLLYFKERLLAADHPNLVEMQAFNGKLRKAGIPATEAGGAGKGGVGAVSGSLRIE